ncbi:nitrate respiration regulation response regulator NreC [Ravibacter arvi]|uniref:Nitrate respiration regulation response regulator NreC n=1 Tax=Ravibacter arvi TaxID=2051041 RepID=A0ABP8LNJ8_9BACT
MKKIIIADDHTMFIKGMLLLLSDREQYEVIAVARNGQEVLDLLAGHTADILLLDVNMPVMNGYQATLKVRSLYPKVKIVVLSMLADESSIVKMLEAGADGYLVKNADEEELYEALATVLNNQVYIARAIRDKVSQAPVKSGSAAESVQLSSRELDISRLIIDGLTNSEIADRLYLSVRTVETHRKNILAKLNLKNTASLVKYLMDNKPFLDL